MWNNVTSKERGKPSSELCPCSEAICENYCTTCYFQLKIKFRLVYNIWAGRHLVTVAKCPNIVLDDLINSRKTGHLSSLQKKLESHCHSVWLLCMNLTPITEKLEEVLLFSFPREIEALWDKTRLWESDQYWMFMQSAKDQYLTSQLDIANSLCKMNLGFIRLPWKW